MLSRKTPLFVVLGLLLFSFANTGLAGDEKKTMKFSSESEEAVSHFNKGVYHQQNVYGNRAAEEFKKALEADSTFGLATVMYYHTKPGLPGAKRREGIAKGMAKMSDASTGEWLWATVVRAMRSGDGDGSAAALQALSSLYPDDANIAFYVAGRVQGGERLAAFEKFAEHHPEVAAAHNDLAYASWANGDKRAALKHAAKYVELAPDHPNSHDSYGEVLQWSGLLDEAVKHYLEASELDPEYTAGYLGAADAYAILGDADAAVAQLDKAIEHAESDQNRINYKRMKAAAYLAAGDHKAASKVLKEVVKESDVDGIGSWLPAIAHEQLAVIDALYGNGKSTAEHLALAEETGASQTFLHPLKVVAHHATGDVGAARAAADAFAEKAEGDDGWSATASAMNALVLLSEGDNEGAMKAVMASSFQNPLEMAVMAHCQKAMGNAAQAAAFKARVLNHTESGLGSPFVPVARKLVGDI